MTLISIFAIVAAAVQLVKQLPVPWFKTRTGSQVINFLAAFTTAVVTAGHADGETLLHAAEVAAGASGVFELVKTILSWFGISLGGGGATSSGIDKVATGGSITLLCLVVWGGLAACITVPYKGEHVLSCTVSRTAEGTDCVTCAGDVKIEGSTRHVAQTLCLEGAKP